MTMPLGKLLIIGMLPMSKRCLIRDPDHGEELKKKLPMVVPLGCQSRRKATATNLITKTTKTAIPDLCHYYNISLVLTTIKIVQGPVLVVEEQVSRLICTMVSIRSPETLTRSL